MKIADHSENTTGSDCYLEELKIYERLLPLQQKQKHFIMTSLALPTRQVSSMGCTMGCMNITKYTTKIRKSGKGSFVTNKGIGMRHVNIQMMI